MWGGGTKKKDGGQGSSKGLELSADGAAAAGSGADVSPSSSSPSAATERQSRAIQFAPHGVASLGGEELMQERPGSGGSGGGGDGGGGKADGSDGSGGDDGQNGFQSPSSRPSLGTKSKSLYRMATGVSPTSARALINDDDYGRGPESELPCYLPGVCGPIHVLHPSGIFRSNWNSLAVVFILYTAIELPMSLAFTTCNTIDSASFWVGVLVDMFFIADLVINIVTGYMSDGEVVLEVS